MNAPDQAKLDSLRDWLLEEKEWSPGRVKSYLEHYAAIGLDREQLGTPQYGDIAQALCDYYGRDGVDGWQSLPPELRAHIRQQALAATGLEAIRLGAALEELDRLVSSAPPPGVGQIGPASRPSALSSE